MKVYTCMYVVGYSHVGSLMYVFVCTYNGVYVRCSVYTGGTSYVCVFMCTYARVYVCCSVYTLCLKKNRTPVTFSNNSNNPGSISTNFGTKNRQLIGA